MIIYLYNDFPMIDLNLNIINSNKKDLINFKEIEYLEKNNIFIKIINNNYEDIEQISCFLKQFENNYFIYLKILFFRVIYFGLKNQIIYNYYIENREVIKYRIKHFLEKIKK